MEEDGHIFIDNKEKKISMPKIRKQSQWQSQLQ